MMIHWMGIKTLVLSGVLGMAGAFLSTLDKPSRDNAEKLFAEGNFAEAYTQFRGLLQDNQDQPELAANDIQKAFQCLSNLGRVSEMDELVSQSLEWQPTNPHLLNTLASLIALGPHHGSLVGGKFVRGLADGQGKIVHATDRDRVRALQLTLDALKSIDSAPSLKATVYMQLANLVRGGNFSLPAWKLQILTDTESLPDYEDGWGYYAGEQGAPVQEDGKPVYYGVPSSWASASNDGERWRWAMDQAEMAEPSLRGNFLHDRAAFLQSQFGEQTLQQWIGWLRGNQESDETDKKSGILALHTLKENETIAKLATGVTRFELPDDQSYIALWKELASDKYEQSWRRTAMENLARVFENRRQYDKALSWWKERLALSTDDYVVQAIKQIEEPWGRFDVIPTQAAGRGGQFDFVYRNAKQATFTAQRIDVETLLADVKQYIRNWKGELDYQQLQIGSDLGYRLVQEGQAKYVKEPVLAEWTLPLKPRADHWDRRVTVDTPLATGGAYWVTAKMEGGHTCHAVLWIADIALVHKPLDNSSYYYVADASTGAPLAKANLEFFGYGFQYTGRNQKPRLELRNFAETTDKDGSVIVDDTQTKAKEVGLNWLISARTPDGKFGFLGFDSIWYAARSDYRPSGTRAFFLTDRPVYRPLDEVRMKAWFGDIDYERDSVSSMANQDASVEVFDPTGTSVMKTSIKLDEYGGGALTLPLSKDAKLGVYSVQLHGYGSGSFRVEEYKKPEFEVTVDSPKEPAKLGEKIHAKISAKYYFGAPVVNATVKYKILRTPHDSRWLPIGPWDWLYGRGYSWLAHDAAWHPTWHSWGCLRPAPWWQPQSFAPPEVVAEREAKIGADGTLDIEIDTAIAKEVHPNQDHRYEITAEVVDASRRVIVGNGSVIAARKAVNVTAWMNKGFYQQGDSATLYVKAHTPSASGVSGDVTVNLLKLSVDADGQVKERLVQTFNSKTDKDGNGEQKFRAAEPGQYRAQVIFSTGREESVEGGSLFVVTGQGPDDAGFEFNDLEIVPDAAEYKVGDTARILINTKRSNGTVLFFARPVNGIYDRPRLLSLEGKSALQTLNIGAADQPNIFVEAVAIQDGKVVTEACRIVVPPEKRVVQVDVLPSSKEYRPGEEATVQVRLTGPDGKPVVGANVVTVYDKSVEYISGGDPFGDIRSFFWSWKREHYPRTSHSLDKYGYVTYDVNVPPMQSLGVFGESLAEDEKLFFSRDNAVRGRSRMLARAEAMDGLAPAAPMAQAAGLEMAKADMLSDSGGGAPAGPAAQPLVQPAIRKEFADTAYWADSLVSDEDGVATIRFKMPDNLTTWKARVWSMGSGTRVGEGAAEFISSKKLLVRPQNPRFFVQNDEVVLSCIVHNYLTTAKQAHVKLETEGNCLELLNEPVQTVTIGAGGEVRVDWKVKVTSEGEALVRMAALTDEESDAAQQTFPAYVHGMLKTDIASGMLSTKDSSGKFTIAIPEKRLPEQSKLVIRYSPTLAGAMVDALPYLADYPYGCTEQTLNRFLPTVITHGILKRMKLNLGDIREYHTNLNAQQLGDAAKRGEQWKTLQRNPVFDEAEVERMTKQGLQRLTEMQLSDGGWGWFSGYGEHSSPHTTAVVVRGMQAAKRSEVAVVEDVYRRGVDWLRRRQDEQTELLRRADMPEKQRGKLPYKTQADDMDAFVYMVLVDDGVSSAGMRDFLYRDRQYLSVYTKAMFALALHKEGQTQKRDMLLRNIKQFEVQDNENQTVYLKLPAGYAWWYWYGSEYEAHAYYLKLLSQVDPQGDTAPRLAKYLLNSRQNGSYWKSTRDTALCVEALAEFWQASGEAEPNMTVEVLLDGKIKKTVKITRDNLFRFEGTLELTGDDLPSGEHTVEFRKQGSGPLYFNGYSTNFTLEDFITAAGMEVKVQRKLYRLTRAERKGDVQGAGGRAVKQDEEKYVRTWIGPEVTLNSGDLIEVELEIESKNDYEYLLFEDMKAAGCEAVEIRSGYGGNELGAYMEMRDERTTFFLTTLRRGKHSLSYRLRAEAPGKFSALPAKVHAMYAPELVGNSDEAKLTIKDRAE